MNAKRDPVKISISSGKGGVGKTSITVNLAFALSRRGWRTLVVDGDMGLANVDVLLKLDPQKTLRDVLESDGEPMDAVVFLDPHFAVLPASSGVPEMVALEIHEQMQLSAILDSIATHFDYLLLDTAAGIGSSVLWLNTFANHNVIVVTPDPTSLTDAYALIKVLSKDYGREGFYIVMNSVESEREGLQTFENLARVAAKFLEIRLRYLGAIPHDKAVVQAVRDQEPLLKRAPDSKAGLALWAVTDRLLELVEGPG